ncbi:MAG TPA: hypothetical protein VGS58_13495, partial [Candidatus Sulfopaludibacter sp.]|nr:hypothetical protein [Candidatus Sulfopaludibacter sp.]
MRNRILMTMLAGWTVAAQTQIDLRTQAKSVDFSAASSTKPLKTGGSLPATCAVGEVFFNTSAAAGANFYACTAANQWSSQGGISGQNCWVDSSTNVLKCQDAQGNVYATVKTSSNGTTNQWVDYISPSGVPHTSQPTAGGVGAVADPGQNGIPYRSGAGTAAAATADKLSGPFFCQDAGSSSAYQCSLTPAIGGYAAGTLYWFRANTANSGPATISFNGLAATSIKKLTNQGLVAGDIKAG